MSTNEAAARLVQLSIGLLLICVLYYWVYRPHLRDEFRQKLFAIRDELFDFAADGGIPFEHPAYCTLRADVNRLIRFAERLSLSRVVLVLFFVRAPFPEYRTWASFTEGLPPWVCSKLAETHSKVQTALLRYMFQRSLSAIILYLVAAVIALWVSSVRNFCGPLLADRVEKQAYQEDSALAA